MSLRLISDQLIELIDECIWQPKYDPTRDQLETAAKALNALDALGMRNAIPDYQALLDTLRRDNNYGIDFLQ
jgi:phenylalanine-4-hydroxylase